MAINAALLRHGLFTELSIRNALKRFEAYVSPNPAHANPADGIDRFIFALKDMDIQTVWIQLFTRSGDVDKNNQAQRKVLLARLKQANILFAGWGYCAGKFCDRDIELIKAFKDDLELGAFIIDAEPGNRVIPNPANRARPLPDKWTEGDFDKLTTAVANQFGTDSVAVSTWPVLKVQDSTTNPVIKLMRIAAPRVALFAPQAYWMTFPKQVHFNLGFKEADFPRNDPESYVRLVIESWRRLDFTNPLVVSGQAYWGEGSPARTKMEAKAAQFVTTFAGWPKIVGFNWYHAGGRNSEAEGSMSDAMITSIANAKLGAKPYQQA